MTPPGRTSQDTDTQQAVEADSFDDASEFDEDEHLDDPEATEEVGEQVGEQVGEEFGSDLQQDDELPTDSLDEAGELEAAVDDDVGHDVTVVPPDVEFDDDGQDLATAVAGEDDDDAEVDGVSDREFVCRSCFMAKRDTQLADADRLLCRDCA